MSIRYKVHRKYACRLTARRGGVNREMQTTSWLGKWYQKIWFYTEFWLTPVDRRPWTFCMRDWIYRHVPQAVCLIVLFYTGMVALSIWHGTASTVTVAIGSFVLAHLVWGTFWIEGQQEFPEYLGG